MGGRLFVIPGIVVALMGFVWMLQGLRVIPGTFMFGNPTWVLTGSITFLIGLVLVGVGTRRKTGTSLPS